MGQGYDRQLMSHNLAAGKPHLTLLCHCARDVSDRPASATSPQGTWWSVFQVNVESGTTELELPFETSTGNWSVFSHARPGWHAGKLVHHLGGAGIRGRNRTGFSVLGFARAKRSHEIR